MCRFVAAAALRRVQEKYGSLSYYLVELIWNSDVPSVLCQ